MDYRARPSYELRTTNDELRNAGDEVAPGDGQVRSRSGSLPGTEAPSLIELLEAALDEVAWDSFSRGSAIRRADRAGFARNVCVALGNWGSPEAAPALISALSDSEPLVRGHSAWALGRIGFGEAALRERLEIESDPWVREEIVAALSCS
jgi:epoxyqueuosine reductase